MKTLNKLAVFAVLVITIIAATALSTSAATEYTSGVYTYTLEDGKANITSIDESVGGVVQIPSKLNGYTVASIGYNAFRGNTEITSITIPDTVKSLGNYSFRDCSGLQSLRIGNGVTDVPYYGFAGCSNLESIIIGNKVATIGEHAFDGCSSLTTITWGSSVNRIDHNSFINCSSLTTVKIPNTVTYVGDSSFQNCTRLENLTIGTKVEAIGSSAFRNCVSLKSVTIPSNVKAMGWYVFRDCTRLTTITIGNGLEAIPYYGFQNCDYLTTLKIGTKVQKIEGYAFDSCEKLTNVTWGSNLKTIENNAFCDCKSITSIAFPGTITYIGDSAFQNAVSLTSVTFGNKVNSIGSSAFRNCSALKSVTIPSSVEALGWYIFRDCTSISSVTIGNGLKSIPYYGFQNCDNLTTLKIGTKVEKIEGYAFDSCEKLKNITWGYCLKTIENNAFYDCKSLTSLMVPATVTSIGNSAFQNCTGVSSLIIGYRVASIGDSAFRNMPLITKVEIPTNTTTIGYYAFRNCSNLKTVYLPKKLQNINYYAFRETGLQTIHYAGSATDWTYVSINEQSGISGATLVHNSKLTHAKPKITVQPKNATAFTNQEAVTTVTATGTGLIYEWYYCNAGDDVFMKTGSYVTNKYNVAMTKDRSGRKVYCVITDVYGGKVTSNTVTLKLKVAAKITTQPKSVSAYSGKTAKVSLAAVGDGATYTWYYANKGSSTFTKTTSFTGKSYSVAMNKDRAGRRVYCVVKDKYGNSVKSNVVTLSMRTTLKVTKQPVNVSVFSGKTAKVSFTAQGDGLTYTWYYAAKGSSTFSKTTSFKSNVYSVAMNSSRAGRKVYCVVKDKYGSSVRTNTVTLGMKVAAQITKQPVSVSVIKGNTAKVSLTAKGDGLTYKWYYAEKGSSTFKRTTSFTGNSYAVTMNAARNGRRVYCIVSDKYGNAYKSNVVTLKMK